MNKHQLFEELYEKHKDKVYRLCSIMVYDKVQIADLYQEVLINIWKGIDNFQGKSKIETWIYRIVVNASINFNLRQKKHREKVKYSNDLVDLSKEEKNENDTLLEGIGFLKNADKAIIGLYLEGYQYKEIAEILGMSTSNTGVRINRIKVELKSLLNNKN